MPKKKIAARGLFGPSLERLRKSLKGNQEFGASAMKVGKEKYSEYERGVSRPSPEEWSTFRKKISSRITTAATRRLLEETCSLYRVEEELDRGATGEEIFEQFKELPFEEPGWRCALSLKDHPDLAKGGSWPVESLLVKRSGEFRLPEELRGHYKAFAEDAENIDRFRLFDDNAKFMLVRNPAAFTDSKTLQLEFKSCRWSEVIYYQRRVLSDPTVRSKYIGELVRGSGFAQFPNGSALHLVIVTLDKRILLCKRSPSKGYVYPGTWSASGEEGLTEEDFESEAPLLNTGRRLLSEELGLDESHFKPDDMRILSVFLEAEPPVLAMCFCGCVTLTLAASKLSNILKYRWRAPDRDEFVGFDYLPIANQTDKGALVRELLNPTGDRVYHPTSGYRILMMLRNIWGELSPGDWVRAAVLTN
jgi:transcriptional regulator with XRE-family HTH domain